MRKIEFSKLIFITMYVTALSFSILTAITTLVGLDSSSLANISLALWTSVGVGEAAYYGKAKAENLLKIGKSASQEELDKATIAKQLAE